MAQGIGKTFIIIGIVIVIAGIILVFKDSIPFLRHIGRLPGDINIHRENFSFHFPIVTSLIISVIISLILYLITRFKG